MRVGRLVLGTVMLAVLAGFVAVVMLARADDTRLGEPVHIRSTGTASARPTTPATTTPGPSGPSTESATRRRAAPRPEAPRVTRVPPTAGDDHDDDDDRYDDDRDSEADGADDD